MRILILTQYFPPEVGAPQNRLYELAVRLKARGAEVIIVTAIPNYPQMVIHENYKGRWYVKEEMDGLEVHRSSIYVSTSKGIVKRLMNYFSFTFSSLFTGLFRTGKVDVLICESPPLFLGISAYLIQLFKGAKFVFNVSDLWPESAEKMGLVTNRTALKAATWLEEFLYKRSDLISGQTQGIVSNISSRFPHKPTYWLPNGVDLNYYNVGEVKSTWRDQNGYRSDQFIFLYAGIIGHAQGLEVILKAADRLRQNDKIQFVLLGSGPEKSALLELQSSLQLSNVRFFDAVTKKDMPAIVAAVNAAVIPLRKLDLFLGAIPSKIFENLAMKKPILLGVEGEAKDLFITQGKAGLAFEPENDEELARQAERMASDPQLTQSMGENGYHYVQQKFTRDIIAEAFWQKLNTLFPHS